MKDLVQKVRDIHHSFNNNLFIISGKAQLLAEETTDSHLREDLDTIFQKIQQCAELLRDVYVIARKYQDYNPDHTQDTEQDDSTSHNNSPKRQLSAYHILFSDADFINLDVLRDLLEDDGYLVSAVSSYRGLIRQLNAHNYKLIVVDENLPGFNLDALSMEISLLSFTPKPKIILLTSSNTCPNPDIHIIKKPVSIETLKLLIHKLVQNADKE